MRRPWLSRTRPHPPRYRWRPALGVTGRMLAIGAVALAVGGCGGTSSDVGPTTGSPRNAQTPLIQTVSSPAVSATVRELPNPLRGQYEALLLPLFPQGNPAQRGHAAWPRSDDASTRVSWRQLQPVDP